jgi:hypothetical protein
MKPKWANNNLKVDLAELYTRKEMARRAITHAATQLAADYVNSSSYGSPSSAAVRLTWPEVAIRRIHSCILDEIGIDPQVRADQMGNSVDVNQNQYTRFSLNRRVSAVSALEEAVEL